MSKSKSHPCKHPTKAVKILEGRAFCKKCGATGIAHKASYDYQAPIQNPNSPIQQGDSSPTEDLQGDESAGVRGTTGILDADDSGRSVASDLS